MIDVTVYGAARPQGGLAIGRTKDGRSFLRHTGNAKLQEWRQAIKAAVGEQMDGPPVRDAVRVIATFYISRPKAHFTTKGALRPSAPMYPVTRSGGDIDKLTRSTLDALTGIAFTDDSQVVVLDVAKKYADFNPVSARIMVLMMGNEADLALAATGTTP